MPSDYTPESIVRALAKARELHASNPLGWCVLCGSPDDHDAGCPFRRAVEWCREHPEERG